MRLSDGRVHFSDLKAMGESPAHYRYQVEEGRPDTPSLSLGRLVHALALRHAEDAPTVHAYPGPARRGNAYDAWRAGLPDGAEECTAADLERAQAIADALWSDPCAARWLDCSQHEIDLTWDWCGLPCAGRIDGWDPGRGLLWDLKTTSRSAGPGFAHEARRYSYHAQLAWYRIALEQLGHDVREVGLIVVSTTPPHVPAVYRLTEAELEAGERICRAWMERLAQCEAANEWPGYSSAPMELGIVREEYWE